jgi:hypothetical protein
MHANFPKIRARDERGISQETAKPPGGAANDRPAAGEMGKYGGCGHDWQGISGALMPSGPVFTPENILPLAALWAHNAAVECALGLFVVVSGWHLRSSPTGTLMPRAIARGHAISGRTLCLPSAP